MQRPIGELLEFPCDHIFKAFGPARPEGAFPEQVRAAAGRVVPVSADQLKVRASREGTYVCVSLVVRLQNAEQLAAIYRALQQLPGLRYLL